MSDVKELIVSEVEVEVEVKRNAIKCHVVK
jgi:hypothetical protein